MCVYVGASVQTHYLQYRANFPHKYSNSKKESLFSKPVPYVFNFLNVFYVVNSFVSHDQYCFMQSFIGGYWPF